MEELRPRMEALQTQLHAHEVHCGGAVGQLVRQMETMHRQAAEGAARTHHLERSHRQVRVQGGASVDLVGSHGRWKRPCLQTAHMTI
jgi:hypothetical protein